MSSRLFDNRGYMMRGPKWEHIFQRVRKLTDKKTRPHRYEFTLGESVLFIYRKKDRVIQVLAKISNIYYSDTFCRSLVDGRAQTGLPERIVVAYTIQSQFGGELMVPPDSLRPGGPLDRIAAAIEEE